MGQPGTGKTIFVEQILFANADAGRPVFYFTTLSEPMKVVRFVEDFAFFDEKKLGTSVIYEDIGAELAGEGVSVLVPRLKEVIKTISYMSDNLVVLGMRGEEKTRRTIRVLNTRGSGHDPAVREISIGPEGVALTLSRPCPT